MQGEREMFKYFSAPCGLSLALQTSAITHRFTENYKRGGMCVHPRGKCKMKRALPRFSYGSQSILIDPWVVTLYRKISEVAEAIYPI